MAGGRRPRVGEQVRRGSETLLRHAGCRAEGHDCSRSITADEIRPRRCCGRDRLGWVRHVREGLSVRCARETGL